MPHVRFDPPPDPQPTTAGTHTGAKRRRTEFEQLTSIEDALRILQQPGGTSSASAHQPHQDGPEQSQDAFSHAASAQPIAKKRMKHRSSKDDVQASVSAADTNGKALQKAERKAARKAARKAVKRREKAEHKAAATAAAAVEGTTSTYQIQSSRNDIQAQTESNLDSSEALASLLWLDRALQDSDLQQPDHGPSRVPPPPPPAPTTATDAVDSSEAPASCADAQSASVGPEELNTTAPSQAQLVQNGQKRDRNKPSVQQSADQGSCSTSSKARVTPKGKEKGNIDPTPVSAIRLGATSSAKLVAARKVASELQYRKSAAKGDESVATSNGQSGGGGVSAADPDAAARSARQQHVVDNARGLTHEEMLADKMYADNELYWLADAYGLQWIRGRFTKIESDAIMEAIDKWRKGRGLSEQELLDQLFKESASAKRTRKDLEDDMWSIATRAAPGRASVAVRRHVREKLRPGMAKGPWSVEEQIALAKAVQEFGVGKWTKVSERIGRSMVDCKARWRTNPNMPSDAGPSTQARVSGETSQTGEAAASGSSAAGTPSKPRRKWANPQDDLLAHAVDEWCQENDANPATDRIGWKVIATRLQKELGDVTGHQCMKRWLMTHPSNGVQSSTRRFGLDDGLLLLQRMKAQQASRNLIDDTEIDWKALSDVDLPFTYIRLQNWWNACKKRDVHNFRGSLKARLDFAEEAIKIKLQQGADGD